MVENTVRRVMHAEQRSIRPYAKANSFKVRFVRCCVKAAGMKAINYALVK